MGIWKCIKEIKHKNEDKKIKTMKNETNEVIEDERAIANIFANYFTDIGKKMAMKIEKKINKNDRAKMKTMKKSFYLNETDPDEIFETIMTLENKKAPGYDGITNELMRYIGNDICHPMVYIINKCFATGIFPKCLKVSIIQPIFKSGDENEISNYRPISLLSGVSKIIEKLIKKRIIGFLEKFQILSEQQYGFRDKKSTEDALLDLTGKIYNAIDKKRAALCVFVDLAKAFDTVSHSKLLSTLENAGIRGLPLRLLKSYLTGRTQLVKINNCLSDPKTIEYGVPQGSVLGPILFIIYMNELFSIETEGHIVSFADDSAIFYQSNDWVQLKNKVETDFVKIMKFFDSKLLTVNFTKTYFMPFCSYQSTLPMYDSIKIILDEGEVFITKKNNLKYLGVIMDCHLKWNEHIDYVTKKIRSLIPIFKNINKILHDDQIKIVYSALVESHLNYGITAWGGVLDQHLRKLQVAQKYILKVMAKKTYTFPTDALYKETKTLDIRQLYCIRTLIKQYKKTSELAHHTHSYQTRHKKNAVLPKTKKSILQRSFKYIGPKLYNYIPESIKTLPFHIFKKKVKNWTTEMDRKTIHEYINVHLA